MSALGAMGGALFGRLGREQVSNVDGDGDIGGKGERGMVGEMYSCFARMGFDSVGTF